MKRVLKWIGILGAAALLLAGCGAARHQETAAQKRAKKAHQAALLAAKYKQQYLTDVTPMNNADDVVSRARTNQQNRRALNRLAAIQQSTAAKMLRQQWPASAKADITAFATALSVESGANYAVASDFKFDTYAHCTSKECFWSGNDESMGPDLQRDTTDTNQGTALAQKCRADLGLPPITG